MYPLVGDLSSIKILITNAITIVIGTINTIMIYFSFQILFILQYAYRFAI